MQTHRQNRTHLNAARPGFSLIELTAVLVILGILMAGAAVAVPAQVKRARIKTTKTSMQTIKTQINTYMVENAGDAPETLLVLIPSFMEEGSEIDAFKVPYYYRPTPGVGLAHPYELTSAGPDKEFGTEDDISVWNMRTE
ncbi:MAG: prepilin-type N-terminal cleavage/methylation domain-containing protein [Phycisphaerales bacterium]|nr:prepilin-type N-terminal cleavage/methylation domain-containing protein [Phycisphaerales bacterium]